MANELFLPNACTNLGQSYLRKASDLHANGFCYFLRCFWASIFELVDELRPPCRLVSSLQTSPSFFLAHLISLETSLGYLFAALYLFEVFPQIIVLNFHASILQFCHIFYGTWLVLKLYLSISLFSSVSVFFSLFLSSFLSFFSLSVFFSLFFSLSVVFSLFIIWHRRN